MRLPRPVARATTLCLLSVLLGGCHLIFRYEDRPADGAVAPDLVVKADGSGKKDGRGKRDGRFDLVVPPDLKPPADTRVRKWTAVTVPSALPGAIAVWGEDGPPVKIFLVGIGWGMLLFDGGKPSKSLTLGTTSIFSPQFNAVGHLDSKRVIAVGYGNRALARISDWTSPGMGLIIADPSSTSDAALNSWNAVWCSANKSCFTGGTLTAGGGGGLFRLSNPSGMFSWKSVCPKGLLGAVSGVWGISENEVYAVGEASDGKSSLIVRYDASATNKCAVKFPSSSVQFAGVWAGSGMVLAVGEAKTGGLAAAVRLTDLQKIVPTASFMKTGTHPPLRAVFGNGGQKPVMVGDKGIVLRHDGGTTLMDMKQDRVTTPITSVWMSKAGDIYGVSGNTLLRYR